jgi:ABC-type dipeptide/oligopeptide/nickel transport system permease subunit
MGLPVSPNAEFQFGTDHLGRDVLVRLANGAQVSLTVGVLAAVAAAFIGITGGMIAG